MVSRARHSSKRRCGSGGPWLSGSLSLVHGCERAWRGGARRAGPMSACGVAWLCSRCTWRSRLACEGCRAGPWVSYKFLSKWGSAKKRPCAAHTADRDNRDSCCIGQIKEAPALSCSCATHPTNEGTLLSECPLAAGRRPPWALGAIALILGSF